MKKLCVMLVLVLAGCSSHRSLGISSASSGRSDRAIWEEGERLLGKKHWEEARQQLKRLVDGFPNSEFLPQARMAMGDAYFQQGGNANDILAISEYRQFLTLYPSHPQSDYAQYQIAECYFAQRHGPQRDQTPLHQAMDEYQKTIDLHPDSPYAEKAKARITEGRRTLAQAEFSVGYFYQRTRQSCHSAVPRYAGVVAQYPEFEAMDEVLVRLGQCLIETGRGAEAAPHLQRLIDSYPNSRFVADARELLKKAGPSPAATATPTASLK